MIRYKRDDNSASGSLIILIIAFLVTATMAIVIWQSGETARMRGVWPAAASLPAVVSTSANQ